MRRVIDPRRIEVVDDDVVRFLRDKTPAERIAIGFAAVSSAGPRHPPMTPPMSRGRQPLYDRKRQLRRSGSTILPQPKKVRAAVESFSFRAEMAERRETGTPQSS
jgi:hypothetical protein